MIILTEIYRDLKTTSNKMKYSIRSDINFWFKKSVTNNCNVEKIIHDIKNSEVIAITTYFLLLYFLILNATIIKIRRSMIFCIHDVKKSNLFKRDIFNDIIKLLKKMKITIIRELK